MLARSTLAHRGGTMSPLRPVTCSSITEARRYSLHPIGRAWKFSIFLFVCLFALSLRCRSVAKYYRAIGYSPVLYTVRT